MQQWTEKGKQKTAGSFELPVFLFIFATKKLM
jgi:hypothetical protein